MEKGGVSTVCVLVPKVMLRQSILKITSILYFYSYINWVFTCNLWKESL